jgi:hypothetical protein
MSILMFIVGSLLTALSGLVLVIMARLLIYGQQAVGAQGIREMISIHRGSVPLLGAGTIGLILGVSLIALSYR